MRRTIYVPTEIDKAEMCRLLHALVEAGISTSFSAQNLRVSSLGFSLINLNINDVRILTKKIKDVKHHKNKMGTSAKSSHRLPVGYTHAYVVKQLRGKS